jgi:hypothetical protein
MIAKAYTTPIVVGIAEAIVRKMTRIPPPKTRPTQPSNAILLLIRKKQLRSHDVTMLDIPR